LLQGSLAVAGLALLRMPGLAEAFSIQPGEDVLPWLDQPAPNPVPEVIGNQLQWEALDSWITPNDQFFTIAHYDKPVLDAATWRLQVGGLIQQPMVLTLDDIKARPRQEITFTLECSGNNGLPFFWGGIGNATWAGTPLAPLLQQAGVLDQGIEVVFFGSDMGVEDVRDIKMPQHMARSIALADALDPGNLLCYEMNGEPLPQSHGFPLRLIAPGWYGIANTKWLQRIEVFPTRYQNRFMARDYVTIREQVVDGQSVWTETSVGRARLKSAPAKVTRDGGRYRIVGAAWGAPIAQGASPDRWRALAGCDDRRRAGRRVCLETVVIELEQTNGGRAQHHLTSDRCRRSRSAGAGRPWISENTPTGRATDRSPGA